MLLRAQLLDAPTPDSIRFVPDGAIVIDPESGTLRGAGEHDQIAAEHPDEPHFEAPDGSRFLIVPGLIDAHAHLPQYPAVARQEASLLPWLERHIFPLETDFKGAEQREFIEAFFDEVARNGTTTIVLYSAIWEDTTDLAFQVAEEKGIRAIIGKVMMDDGSYGDQQPVVAREKSLTQSRRLIEKWHGAARGRLECAVAPRFAVTCSMDLMREAAELAAEHDVYLQTHLSENLAEIETVRGRFPGAASYTDVYRQAGLLTPKMLLGHGIHLVAAELAMIADSGARITHCPTSNFFLNSGLFPIDRVEAAGIPVALGSDVAGGPELNMWQVMRSAIEVQKSRRFAGHDTPELTPAKALHLATAGAAHALHKGDYLGTLDAGKHADFTLLDLNKLLPLGGQYTPAELDPDHLLTACIYRGKPEATVATFVRGRKIH